MQIRGELVHALNIEIYNAVFVLHVLARTQRWLRMGDRFLIALWGGRTRLTASCLRYN